LFSINFKNIKQLAKTKKIMRNYLHKPANQEVQNHSQIWKYPYQWTFKRCENRILIPMRSIQNPGSSNHPNNNSDNKHLIQSGEVNYTNHTTHRHCSWPFNDLWCVNIIIPMNFFKQKKTMQTITPHLTYQIPYLSHQIPRPLSQ